VPQSRGDVVVVVVVVVEKGNNTAAASLPIPMPPCFSGPPPACLCLSLLL
jgi:hypothetical protein